jgi:hypothetical protein
MGDCSIGYKFTLICVDENPGSGLSRFYNDNVSAIKYVFGVSFN